MSLKKACIILALLIPVFICGAGLRPPDEPKAKNLKVLPKDISHEELDKVMDEFKSALGVKCGFCHAQKTDGSNKLDFASDANPHKDIAREMMRMTKHINKKFFKPGKDASDGAMMKVGCMTCHNGQKEPKTS